MVRVRDSRVKIRVSNSNYHLYYPTLPPHILPTTTPASPHFMHTLKLLPYEKTVKNWSVVSGRQIRFRSDFIAVYKTRQS